MKIIAADDEKRALKNLVSTINTAVPDAEVFQFSDAASVLEFAKTTACQVAFLDIEMGEMNGLELSKKLKILNPRINIVFTTGYSEYMPQALALHASGYLLKPFTAEDLANEMENLINPIGGSSVINVALCEDNALNREVVSEQLNDYFASRDDVFKLHTFADAESLADTVSKQGGFSIYLLDIILPGMNGVDLARQLRENGDKGVIIFLTASSDYTFDAFDVNAFQYLVKPVEKLKLTAVMDKAVNSVASRPAGMLTVRTPEGESRVDIESILYVERENRALAYYTEDGKRIESQKLRGPFIEAVAPLLKNEKFRLAGSAMLVNVSRIVSIDEESIIFEGDIDAYPPQRSIAELKREWKKFTAVGK